MAIINLGNQQEIIDDLNNIVFSLIDNKYNAEAAWNEVEEFISNGCTEDFIYAELPMILERFNDEGLVDVRV